MTRWECLRDVDSCSPFSTLNSVILPSSYPIASTLPMYCLALETIAHFQYFSLLYTPTTCAPTPHFLCSYLHTRSHTRAQAFTHVHPRTYAHIHTHARTRTHARYLSQKLAFTHARTQRTHAHMLFSSHRVNANCYELKVGGWFWDAVGECLSAIVTSDHRTYHQVATQEQIYHVHRSW